MTESKGVKAPRQTWTKAQEAELIRRYPNEHTPRLAESLNRPLAIVFQKAYNLGLKKSKTYLASPDAGRTDGTRGGGSRFTKGGVPWNKDKNFEAGGRSADTRFKPGRSPHSSLPIGSYRVTDDGTLQRKVTNTPGNNSKRWRGVHELVWTEANGPLPPKHIVVFKPGQRTAVLEEITIDRVECISLAENMRRNTVHNMPKELTHLVLLRGAITRQINKRTKQDGK